jgi:acyl-homoserine-lactone acylase
MPTCRGKPWVKPITTLDAYLLVYQAIEFSMQQEVNPGAIATAHPPAGAAAALRPATVLARTGQGLSAARAPEGIGSNGIGSNGIAIGSAGTRDHRAGMLLGNPHFLWDGPERFYQVQLTIPGTLNVEGATFYGIPLVIVGFTATMAWTLTSTPSPAVVPYQLTLVPGHPTEYMVDGKAEAMTSQPVTVQERTAAGTLASFHDTVYYSRYGPVIDELRQGGLPWTASTAFTLTDVNSGNFRFLNTSLATDESGSVPAELTVLKKYEGLPWMDVLAADSAGHAAYADIGAIPHISDAELASCDTPLGATAFKLYGLPVLDGSRSSCALGTDADSAAPGIFGPAQEPVLRRGDFVANSNDSYWMTNPAHPLTGFPAVIAGSDPPGTDLGLRTRSAITMITRRIAGTDGLGPAGFTLQNMKNLMFSDIQYGATLVKARLVTMCQSFPGGRAPTSTGGTVAVGDSCDVLAAWNGRENPDSRGAALFQAFWCPFVFASNSAGALCQSGGPWTHPFSAADPVGTPNGLDTASTAVQQAFGDALASLTAAHLPYDVPLGQVQYVVRNGQRIPLPGGPGDPNGEFNAIDQLQTGADPIDGSSYIKAVTWNPGRSCPQAATLLTYSQSGNPTSPHYADQTRLFSQRQWVTPYFCAAQVAAHAVSVMQVRSPAPSRQ